MWEMKTRDIHLSLSLSLYAPLAPFAPVAPFSHPLSVAPLHPQSGELFMHWFNLNKNPAAKTHISITLDRCAIFTIIARHFYAVY